jgi:hypothetical protein
MSAAKKGLGRGFESLIPTDLIDENFNLVAEEGWSSRKIEQYIAKMKQSLSEGPSGDDVADEYALRVAERGKVFAGHLGERLSAKVNVKLGVRGAGKIVIDFKTPEELERIQELLGE